MPFQLCVCERTEEGAEWDMFVLDIRLQSHLPVCKSCVSWRLRRHFQQSQRTPQTRQKNQHKEYVTDVWVNMTPKSSKSRIRADFSQSSRFFTVVHRVRGKKMTLHDVIAHLPNILRRSIYSVSFRHAAFLVIIAGSSCFVVHRLG